MACTANRLRTQACPQPNCCRGLGSASALLMGSCHGRRKRSSTSHGGGGGGGALRCSHRLTAPFPPRAPPAPAPLASWRALPAHT